MIKIFFVGDFKLNTGPGIANKAIKKGMQQLNTRMLYSDADNKVIRVLEMIIKTVFSDCVCFCSPSKGNIIGINIAKLLRKKTFYIMHGYLTLEKKINDEMISKENIEEINKFEKYIFRNTEKTFCVSESFMKFMKKTEPEYAYKFDYNYNGLDLNMIKVKVKKYEQEKLINQIVSIGGGMKIKNNLAVCKAIEKLNIEKGYNLKYIVIGLPFTDKKEIAQYDFVTYYNELSHDKVIEILSQSYLYIQNSKFETFGLAIIEALVSKCNLLVSNNVGSIGVIKTIYSDDLIYNTDNVDEIAEKIEKIYKSSNADRLLNGIQIEAIDFEKAAKSLATKISKVVGV